MSSVAAVEAVMRTAGLPERLISEFVSYYESYCSGASGKIPWGRIQAPSPAALVRRDAVATEESTARGIEAVPRLACIKLNGGLGTTMKLSRAKSLITVRDGKTFLQLAVEQAQHLRRIGGCEVPLLFMNSFRTRRDTLQGLRAYAPATDLPWDFLQHKVPRIDVETRQPLAASDPADNWAPPGHGDLYLALLLSGLLRRLADAGYRWAFVSNVDNLAATVDLGLLGYLDLHQLDFAMEVTEKSAADIKGGTLVDVQGRLTLFERAQVEDSHIGEFEDVSRFSVFNTNNLWWRIDSMLQRLERGPLRLPMIVNPKRVADRDVVQLETAMGAAIGCFPRAVGLLVPRSRFAPVKATTDLLAVRSDVYIIDDQGGVRPNPLRRSELGPPVIRLDPQHYQAIEQFEDRCPHPLGLLNCRSLSVEGDVRFGHDVVISGDVVLRAGAGTPAAVTDGARFEDGVFEL